MSLTVDIDLNLLSGQMERFVRELGADGPTVVKDTGRLLLLQLIKITPPKTLKQGRAAIKRDLINALGNVDERKIRMPALKDALRKGDVAATNAILRNLKKSALGNLHAMTFAENLHTGRRNARGRVRRSTGVLALPPAAARAYMTRVQKRSGQAKGAWVPALRVVGGTAPAWITRHGGRFGDVADVHLGPVEDDARLTVINSARGVRSIDQGAVSKSIRIREQAMKTRISTLLRLRAQQNNLA